MGSARDRDSLNAPRDKVQHIFLTSPSRHSTHVHAHTHTHTLAQQNVNNGIIFFMPPMTFAVDVDADAMVNSPAAESTRAPVQDAPGPVATKKSKQTESTAATSRSNRVAAQTDLSFPDTAPEQRAKNTTAPGKHKFLSPCRSKEGGGGVT